VPTSKTGNPWTVLLSKPIYENPWIAVTEHDVLNPAGKPSIYGVVHMKSVATGILPIDHEGHTLLVGQYRFPLKSYSWEIPEGGGKLGVDPLESAQRELAEETGLTARQWLPLATLHLSNSVTDEAAYGFLAWDLEEGIAAPEETEELQVRRVPFAEAFAMAMGGRITDSLAVTLILKARLLAQAGALPKEVARFLKG